MTQLGRLGTAALPVVAVCSIAVGLAGTLWAAGDTLGFDFLAYHQAAARMIAGQPLYDMSFTESGGFGLFYYPPTFAPILLPFGLLPAVEATWAWIAVSLVLFGIGVAILPTSRPVRWWIVLLAGWSFPFVHAVKLGQVGPILFLGFAVGWRWLDQPLRLGVSGAIGAAIKLQPGLVLVWALLTRRHRAVVVGSVTLIGLAAVATLLAGPSSWLDFATLLRTVSDPITTPNNLTPGAVAYRLGAPPVAATLVQTASTVGALAMFLGAIRWCAPAASYLVAVVVSQLISPILWDHYAMLLLLPVAYLLAAGRWWALALPLVTAWPLIGVTPAIVYPVVFWASMVAVFLTGMAARESRATTPMTVDRVPW